MGKKKGNHPDSSLFDKQKASTLSALQEEDKSRKGSVDAPIHNFVSTINNHPDFFTLSSCSGRILLSSGVKKQGLKWIYASHQLGAEEEFLRSLDNALQGDEFQSGDDSSPILMFKMEAFILHVQCRNTEFARAFLLLATESGFRNSGITLSKSGKVVLAIRSSHGLEVPLFLNKPENSLSVSHSYLAQLLVHANQKMAQNEKRHKDLFERFSSAVWDEPKKVLKPQFLASPMIKGPRPKEVLTCEPLLDLEDSLKGLLEEA
uniref:tRNA wybutosine-synthesizing protein 3 homolog n=1 Tax=Caligus clemensi TaxID=344056 RepID=C1C229_CALCM|nr:tRNA wybutosine-synthesizing protein 3 homolog [Caligus clemensi]